MQLFRTVAGLSCYLNKSGLGFSPKGQQVRGGQASASSVPSLGLVPTMGALHAGHLSLIKQARQENDVVIVSIFVNPLQFGPTEDLLQYPHDFEQDQQRCEQVGVDAIFAPTAAELYGDAHLPPGECGLTRVIPPKSMVSVLCGQSRSGHFQGVCTVVTKLLHLVKPDRAYFGQKDAQQLAIIRRLVEDLNFPVEIVACPTVREVDGLACSSRNRYLTEDQRQQASVLYRSLKQAEQGFRQGQCLKQDLMAVVQSELKRVPSVQVEYVELVHPITLALIESVEETGLLAIAAHLGSTRLIDNLLLLNRQPIVAIDGPAGAGKSTVARQVAQVLGLFYLDTGAMYRAVTWLVLQSRIALQNQPAIAELVSQCRIQLAASENTLSNPTSQLTRVWIDDQEVTTEIRSRVVTAHVSAIAAQPAVRQILVKQQQQYGRKGGIVMEGRDIGTYVFPDAELKIFLTASVQERAQRRQQDLKAQGQPEINFEDLEQSIRDRDQQDSTRILAPLRKAIDAIEIETDGLRVTEVVERIVTLYQQKCHQGSEL
ncbi:MAG: bifunctional pantoate--beta-alanine ligase/(d)CMP kinase [Cyanothece sp. SIO1E1]|nr:bifunctional pantoate--beta-alanine ligase/(d)CMP kinase [Cyanothece sp. SIO1E1]